MKPANIKKTSFLITAETANQRLDNFLNKELPDFSRTRIQNLISEGHICANKQPIKKNYITQDGDKISINIPAPKELQQVAKDFKLDIIYEDKNVVVVNKPAGLSVHPRDTKDEETTLVNALLAHCAKDLSGIGGVLRPGIVHRIDKETSGVIIVAKNDQAHHFLSEQFANRTVEKHYQALVIGRMNPERGQIDSPIFRHPVQRQKMAISNHKKSRPALTEYSTSATYSDKHGSYSLLNIQIFTGRTHQIRVHMEAIGHPLIGDKLYGNKRINDYFSSSLGLKRQFLHAHKLTINLLGGERKTFTADLPEDLSKVLKKIRN